MISKIRARQSEARSAFNASTRDKRSISARRRRASVKRSLIFPKNVLPQPRTVYLAFPFVKAARGRLQEGFLL